MKCNSEHEKLEKFGGNMSMFKINCIRIAIVKVAGFGTCKMICLISFATETGQFFSNIYAT